MINSSSIFYEELIKLLNKKKLVYGTLWNEKYVDYNNRLCNIIKQIDNNIK